jgi:hypothetical protein
VGPGNCHDVGVSDLTNIEDRGPRTRTFGHHEFGAIINPVDRLLRERPDAEQWRDLAVAL